MTSYDLAPLAKHSCSLTIHVARVGQVEDIMSTPLGCLEAVFLASDPLRSNYCSKALWPPFIQASTGIRHAEVQALISYAAHDIENAEYLDENVANCTT